jgi:hypothetical protein
MLPTVWPRLWDKVYCCPTAAKPSIIPLGPFIFLQDLQEKQRADERTRTANVISLRVITQALHGFARGCKARISKGVSFLRLDPCCTVLRSRWCQSGIRTTCSPEFANSKKSVSRLPLPPPPGRWIRPPRESSRGSFATPLPMLSLPCPSAHGECERQPRRGSRGLL